jgi:uncharacterized protein (TIGR02145 family)
MSTVKLNSKLLKLGGKLVTLNPSAPASIVDYDGNVYTSVMIGTQEWLGQNLKTTHYADGTPILNIFGYDDWFLPSKDELYDMWNQLYTWGYGNFQANYYWSSSEAGSNIASVQHFGTGVQTVGGKNNGIILTRPVRAFTSASPSYNLRDIGPAGGWIFYKSGNDYLEASPKDEGFGVWSNVDATTLGTTNTAIGTGQANTTAIIGQVGFTTGAAKKANDLTSNMLWSANTTGAYTYYDSNPTSGATYGAMYNWHAVNNAHGLPITGWRVPSDTDWSTLSTYLGGDTVSGGHMKETGTSHWAVPNTADNSSLLTLLPSGERGPNGNFNDMPNYLLTWSSTSFDSTKAWMRYIGNSPTDLFRDAYDKINGLPIRLIKN